MRCCSGFESVARVPADPRNLKQSREGFFLATPLRSGEERERKKAKNECSRVVVVLLPTI